MGNWFLFLDFYGYRENGMGWDTKLEETSTKEKAKKQNFEIVNVST